MTENEKLAIEFGGMSPDEDVLTDEEKEMFSNFNDIEEKY